MNLTLRQIDVLVAIRNYRSLYGYSPTMQELADQLRISKVSVLEHIGELERKNIIRRNKNLARSVEIIVDERLPDEHRPTLLPLLGCVATGSPIEQIDDREHLDLEQMCQSSSGVYALRIVGDSMASNHLCDGDFIVIERREKARNGETVLVLVGSGTALLRRFHKSNGKVQLYPIGLNAEPMVFDAADVTVQGVVLTMMRRAA